MKKTIIISLLLLICSYFTQAQKPDQPRIILITMDGFRWQELFTGADSLLVGNKEYVSDSAALVNEFWRDTPEERRKVLTPFVWSHISETGQIYGNRQLGNKMDLTNQMWFSYPGYNEILTGQADDQRINSNKKMPNPNVTVLEMINQNPKYSGSVVAFGSWDVFPYIINEERSGVPVNAGFECAQADDLTERELFLNELQMQIPSPWSSVRLDAFTHHYALEYMKKHRPKVVYIAYGETDDFAHDGDYDAYLHSAHTTDGMIRELWAFTQQDKFYKDNTVFLLTTDHGRGTKPLDTWKSHGIKIPDAGEVWFMAFGAGVKAKGEVSENQQLYTNQIAPTIMHILSMDFEKDMPGNPIEIE